MRMDLDFRLECPVHWVFREQYFSFGATSQIVEAAWWRQQGADSSAVSDCVSWLSGDRVAGGELTGWRLRFSTSSVLFGTGWLVAGGTGLQRGRWCWFPLVAQAHSAPGRPPPCQPHPTHLIHCSEALQGTWLQRRTAA